MENANLEEKKDDVTHEEDEFAPTELTPVQEKIEEIPQFQPKSFKMNVDHRFGTPTMLGRGKNGLMLAKFDNKVVYIAEDVEFSLQVLDKFNESNYVCKVLACLEVKKEDKQIATKIAIENPLGADDCPESIMSLEEFISNCQKHSGNGKTQFKEVLSALLDVRLRVPPIFNFDPQFIIVCTKTGSVQLIVSKELFERKRSIQHLTKDDLTYITPEELYGHGRSITSPFWVFGCMLYEAQYNKNPFATVMQA